MAIAAILEAAKVLGGTWQDYALFLVSGIALFIVFYPIARRWRVEESAYREPKIVVIGPVVIPPNVSHTLREVELSAGDVIFGTLVETNRQSFSLSVRTAVEQRKANSGKVSATIGDFVGTATSSFQSQVPAPSGGTYYVDFEQFGDLKGRIVQADLRTRKLS